MQNSNIFLLYIFNSTSATEKKIQSNQIKFSTLIFFCKFISKKILFSNLHHRIVCVLKIQSHLMTAAITNLRNDSYRTISGKMF
jgi:hypothetical protein